MENCSTLRPPPPMVSPATSLAMELTDDDASTDSVGPQQISNQDSVAGESMSTEWTDEKHSLYLKSMEASFVDDLYNSFDLLGWSSQMEQSSDHKLSGEKHASTRISSGQFKILRSGCWGKINFGRHESQVDKADGSGVLLANPWIRHFKSGSRPQHVASPTVQEKAVFGSLAVRASGRKILTSAALAANLEQFPARNSHPGRYDSGGSDIEFTDQNFVDDDNNGEKALHKCNAKRMKTTLVSTPSNDQVVPFGKFPVKAELTKNPFSPERERSRHS